MRVVGAKLGRGTRLLTVVALLGAPMVSSCARAGVECSKTAPTDIFVGRLADARAATASFVVLQVRDSAPPGSVAPVAPALVAGRRVDVRYAGDHARFLRLGSTYLVQVLWVGYFRSDVHVSSDPCSGGTLYADGRSIDTASWTRSHFAEIIAFAAALPVVALATVATVLGTRRRRRRRG